MQPCVIDSCSLLHSFHVQLGNDSLSSLISSHFNVVLHQSVSEEMVPVLARAYRSWRERGLVQEEMSQIRRWHAEWTTPKLSRENLDGEMNLLESENLHSLDRGELGCIALAKATADRELSYVIFITDDYDAGECATILFDKYQVGTVLRSADLISFFGIRYRLSKSEIHQGLRNLIAFYTNLYDSVLREVATLLPGGESSYVISFLRGADFARAREAVSTISLDSTVRTRVQRLVEEVAACGAEKSVVAHSLFRLRQINELRQ